MKAIHFLNILFMVMSTLMEGMKTPRDLEIFGSLEESLIVANNFKVQLTHILTSRNKMIIDLKTKLIIIQEKETSLRRMSYQNTSCNNFRGRPEEE